jgi:hypothetical protein
MKDKTKLIDSVTKDIEQMQNQLNQKAIELEVVTNEYEKRKKIWESE